MSSLFPPSEENDPKEKESQPEPDRDPQPPSSSPRPDPFPEPKRGHLNGIAQIDKIHPCPFQPRSEIDEPALRELMESIQKHGLLQPILVRRLENGALELIAGSRRLEACRRLGHTQIAAYEIKATDAEAEILAILENANREDLSAWEEAQAVGKVRDARLGRGEDATGQALALLFAWSEPKISQRLTIHDGISAAVREAAGVTRETPLMRLSKAALLHAAQQPTDAHRAAALRRSLGSLGESPGEPGQGEPTVRRTDAPPRGKKGKKPSSPYQMQQFDNGTVRLRLEPGRMSPKDKKEARRDLEAILRDHHEAGGGS